MVDLLQLLLPVAKSILDRIADPSARPEAPETNLKDIANNLQATATTVAQMAKSLEQLVEHISQLPVAVLNATKYANQLQAAARRESAACAIKACVLDEALYALQQAESLDSVSYELWILYVVYRVRAADDPSAVDPLHSVSEELRKATSFVAASEELRALEKLAICYNLLVIAKWFRASTEVSTILGYIVSLFENWSFGKSIEELGELLRPLRQMAAAHVVDFPKQIQDICTHLYEAEYRMVWENLRDQKDFDSPSSNEPLTELWVHSRTCFHSLTDAGTEELRKLQELQELSGPMRDYRTQIRLLSSSADIESLRSIVVRQLVKYFGYLALWAIPLSLVWVLSESLEIYLWSLLALGVALLALRVGSYISAVRTRGKHIKGLRHDMEQRQAAFDAVKELMEKRKQLVSESALPGFLCDRSDLSIARPDLASGEVQNEGQLVPNDALLKRLPMRVLRLAGLAEGFGPGPR